MDNKEITTILIAGASSGIGAELAQQYACPKTRLLLVGRDQARLNQIKTVCQKQGAEVISKQLDLCDEDAVAKWITHIFSHYPIDLSILSAGIMPEETIDDFLSQKIIFNTNTQSMFNVITHLIPLLLKKGQGQIALFSSLRAFNSIPQAPAYCSSKAAILQYGLGLYSSLKPHGIIISTICPGYVDTPLTKGYNKKYFCISSSYAAKLIRKGLAQKKPLIAFPFRAYFFSKLFQVLPSQLSLLLNKYLY